MESSCTPYVRSIHVRHKEAEGLATGLGADSGEKREGGFSDLLLIIDYLR